MTVATALSDPVAMTGDGAGASPEVRQAVRDFLTAAPEFKDLTPEDRRRLAKGLVRLCQAVTTLKSEVLATTQAAAPGFGASAAAVAGTTQKILNAVSFPRFVTDLLNGVFKAMLDTNITQLNSYVDLLNNVAASAEGFTDANFGPNGARRWLANQYPDAYEIAAGDAESDGTDLTVTLKDGGKAPTPNALRTDLGLEPDASVPSDPEQLVPLVRARLAKNRQEVLATLVMLGMQRIVIDSGTIRAAMRFHIDTRSVQTEDKGSSLDSRTGLSVSGSYGVGIWGVSATLTESIGYVSTQREQTTEEMNTDLDLNSSVEVNFRTDQVPLDRLASAAQAARIRANTRNPDAEDAAARTQDEARRAAQSAAEAKRQDALNAATTAHAPEPPRTSPPALSSSAKTPAAKPPAAKK